MVERVEDGGPAYPVIPPVNEAGYPYPDAGMSFRDACAIAALPAVIAATCAGQHDTKAASPGEPTELAIARDAYRLADAMIRARSPSEPLNARTQGVEVGR